MSDDGTLAAQQHALFAAYQLDDAYDEMFSPTASRVRSTSSSTNGSWS